MNNSLNKTIQNKHIFFLKLSSNLPENYFHLAEMFLLYDVTLIPVSIKELKDLITSKKQHLIAMSTNIDERKLLKRYQEMYLDHALLRNLIHLYDTTSFTCLKVKGVDLRRQNYSYVNLPIRLSDLVASIFEILCKDSETVKTWPGGRRPRLPKLLQGA